MMRDRWSRGSHLLWHHEEDHDDETRHREAVEGDHCSVVVDDDAAGERTDAGSQPEVERAQDPLNGGQALDWHGGPEVGDEGRPRK